MADFKDLIIVFVVGLMAGWVLREVAGVSVKAQALENIESWEMWEDEYGRLHAEIHRKVKPSE